MPVRRSADPISVQNVWNAIRSANAQKQMADSARITKYLQKQLSCSQVQAELYLKQTLQDELVIAVHKITVKGSKVGNEVEAYKIPLDQGNELPRVSHDWYCIDCHLAGDVLLCATCHRVFHPECAHKKQLVLKHKPLHRKSLNTNTRLSDPLVVLKTTDEIDTNKLEKSCSSISTLELSINHEDDVGCTRISETSNCENNNQNGLQCLSEVSNGLFYDEAVCSVCNMSRTDVEPSVEVDELNYLLTFIFNRIKSWIPLDITKTIDSEEELADWYTNNERKWRMGKLLYEFMDIPFINRKLEAKEYRHPHEFKADVLTIQHNIAVFHGTDTQEYKASEYLLRDTMYETSELSNCLDCYRASNEKVNDKWFCIPCRIPHTLVWAKQLGHPYWPAKVLKENDKYCDVRFFGGKYERAFLSKAYIKPISASIASLNVKKSSVLNKAVKELLEHQKLLKNAGILKEPEENEQPESSKNMTIPFKRNSIPNKAKKRSHSLDKIATVETHTGKISKRRNSSAALNTAIVKPQNTEYATRQTVKKLKRQKRQVASAFPIEEDNSNEDLNEEIVTSSSETLKIQENFILFQELDTKMPKPERQYSESVEMARRKLEECLDKDELIKVALECMQAEIDRITNDHDNYLKKIFELNNNQISDTKKKQWCYNCEQEAIYHCCWNTAYCSLPCQQQHWQSEHKKVCRRKR